MNANAILAEAQASLAYKQRLLAARVTARKCEVMMSVFYGAPVVVAPLPEGASRAQRRRSAAAQARQADRLKKS